MTHAYGRCWIHEDCVSHPEIGAACGPNPPAMQVHDDLWSDDGWSGDGHVRPWHFDQWGDGHGASVSSGPCEYSAGTWRDYSDGIGGGINIEGCQQ